MNKSALPLVLLALVGFTAPVSAQYTQIAYESFDYAAGPLGGLNGGTGWDGEWWAGATFDSGIVVTPGFDAVGEMMQTNIEHEGSYRTLATAGFEPILEGDKFGKDGTSIWLGFTMQRHPMSDDWYGGISLYEKWGGERLMIGSPHSQDWFGIDLPFFGQPTWIPNTDCSIQTRIVCRVDFLLGDERVRMWLDPADEHPTTTADLDTTVPSFVFNEIRVQSGTGGMTGFYFDEIIFSTEDFGPKFAVNNLVAGQTATLEVTNATVGSNVIFAYSMAGGGPIPSPFGPADLSPPVNQLPPMPVNGSGAVSFPVAVPGTLAGINVWAQAAELYAGGGGVLTNSLALTVQ